MRKPRPAEHLTLSIERFDGVDGLSQGLVSVLVEDAEGYLWVGTKDGLNRFDGKSFKVFRHDESDSTSITGNYVISMILDAEGRLWITTRNGGLCCYDPRTERFIRFEGKDVNNGKVTPGAVGPLGALPDGGVMLSSLNSNSLEAFRHVDSELGGQVQMMSSGQVSMLLQQVRPKLSPAHYHQHTEFDAYGNFWFDWLDSIYFYPYPSGGHEPAAKAFLCDSAASMNRRMGLLMFDAKKENVYWMKNREGTGLWKFNWKTLDFDPFLELPEGYASLIHKFVDSKQRLWTWSPIGNILVVDLNDANYTEYEVEWPLSTAKAGLGGRWFEDSRGNVWFGTDGYGLMKISSTALGFKRLPKYYSVKDGLAQTVRTMAPGQHALFDSQVRAKWKSVTEAICRFNKVENLILSLQFLTVDERGDFLVLSHSRSELGSAVFKVDTTDLSVSRFALCPPGDHDYWAHPMIPDSEGKVWFPEKPVEDGHHFYYHDLETGSMEVFDVPIPCGRLEYSFVSDWYEDTLNRRMWFGTTCGLFCFDKNSETWTTYVHQEGDEESLSADMVLSVLPDPYNPTGVLWIGTEGAGLNRFNIETGKFQHYTASNSGLTNDVVNGILADKHNHLWISTNNGLCQFNPRTNEFRTYFRQDGLPDNEFNRYEYAVSEEGEFYLGGMGGWMHFNPENFYETKPASKLVFTGLKLWNKPVVEIGEDAILKKPLAAGDVITLSHENNMVTIEFALLDLTAPHRNRYKYQMEGLSENWVDLQDATEAIFTNIDPGRYTFRVMGCNSSGVWTIEPTELTITILPPWYATWWFRSLMAFVLASLLYGFYRYRLAQLLRMERMRNRIAQDLHDEIGSTISSISLFGSVLKNTMRKDPDKADKLLDRITTYSSQIGERMNDMVWTIKADNDSFEHVVNRMRAYAVAMTESKSIKLNFEVDSKVESLSLEMDIRKNIYLIFKEAVNNAVKYSNCEEITVGMQLHGKRLELRVKDDGVGFDKEAVAADRSSFGGNGLNGMRMRAREMKAELQIETWPNQGTEIKLQVNL